MNHNICSLGGTPTPRVSIEPIIGCRRVYYRCRTTPALHPSTPVLSVYSESVSFFSCSSSTGVECSK